MAEINQRIQPFVHLKNNASAIAAIAAVRPAVGNIFFSSEGYVPIAAFSAFHIYFCSVCKHSITCFLLIKNFKGVPAVKRPYGNKRASNEVCLKPGLLVLILYRVYGSLFFVSSFSFKSQYAVYTRI